MHLADATGQPIDQIAKVSWWLMCVLGVFVCLYVWLSVLLYGEKIKYGSIGNFRMVKE